MKIASIILIAAIAAIAGTTNVRIYHQAVASPASVMKVTTGWVHSIAGVQHIDFIATSNGGTTINTTTKLRPNFTAQFSLADVANKIRTKQFTIKVLH